MILKLLILSVLSFSLASCANIQCSFRTVDNNLLQCDMTINNPLGSDDFTVIDGTNGYNKADVKIIRGYSGSSSNFPKIICESFPNVQQIYFESKGLKTLTGNSFLGCTQLEKLEIHYNYIESVASNTFEKTTKLKYLKMYSQNGKLKSLPQEVFWNLKSLLELDLGSNLGINFPTYVFHNLTSLEWLHVGNCELTIWNQFWFSDLAALKYLHIDNNLLIAIPRFAFHKDSALRTLNVNNNQIKRLSRNSFYSLVSLYEISAQYNNISEIERSIFDDAAGSLRVTNFKNNRCVDTNTFSLTYFQSCFISYDTRTIGE